MTDVTMRQLLEAGAHFGHQTRFWSPKMRPYIYGHRNKIHIINLEQTLLMFNDALNYLSAVSGKRGTVMFVGTKRQAGEIVREQSQRASCPYVYHRWLGGMLTNYRTVRKSIDRLRELEETMQSEGFSKISKKEAMRISREHFRLDRNLAGIRDMQGLPDALFVIDVRHEYIAVQEANKLGIPVVAVVDTNCDPDGVDYVIPGNDDAISSIRLFCTAAAEAVITGHAVADASAPYQGERQTQDESSAAVLNITSARASVAPAREPEGDADTETQDYDVKLTEQQPSDDANSSATAQSSADEAPVTDNDHTQQSAQGAEAIQQVSDSDSAQEPSSDGESGDEAASEESDTDNEVSAAEEDSAESNDDSTVSEDSGESDDAAESKEA